MRKPTINFSIDILAFFAFLFLLSTGLLLYLVLPAGSGGLSVWGFTRHQWGDIHFWIAIFFVSLIAIHFVLHWSWIKSMVKGKANKKMTTRRIAAVVLILLFILMIAIAPFLSSVESSDQERGRHGPAVELKE